MGDIELDMARISTIKETDKITGGFSKPLKMPEWAYHLPAAKCHVGARLQEIRGSVCQRCYTLSNRYRHPNVLNAIMRQFEGIFHPDWTVALTIIVREVKHIRVHDKWELPVGRTRPELATNRGSDPGDRVMGAES